MTLSSPPAFLQPPADEYTRNSQSSGSVAASFDLLSLPGVVLCFVDDSTCTISSGSAGAAKALNAADVDFAYVPRCFSAGTVDSSVLGVDLLEGWDPPGGCATQFKLPFRQPATLDLAALMLLLGSLVDLVVEVVEQSPQSEGAPLNGNMQ